MEIKNNVIIIDNASAKLKQIAKAALQTTNIFKNLEKSLRHFNNVQVNSGWTKQISQQNRLLNQQIAMVSRIYRMSRMIRFTNGNISKVNLSPINLTSAIAAKIKPIDLNGRIRIRSSPNGSSEGRGSSFRSGFYMSHLGDYYLYRQAFDAVVNLGKTIVGGINWVSEQADKQIKGQYKIGLLTPDVQGIQKEIYQSAIRSRVSFQEQMDNVIKMATSAPNAFITPGSRNVNMQKAIMVSETFNKIAKLSGSTQQETSSAGLQFKQALASNRLGGDELRSLKENMPMFINYLAEYLTSMKKFGEVSSGQIKELGRQGKLTADVLVGAMEFAKERVDEQYKNLPMSVGEAMTQIENQFQNAMIPISTMFGRMFNGDFFKPFFDAFNIGFDILQNKLQYALSILSNANGGQALNEIQQGIQNLMSWFGDLAISAAKCANWIIEHWSKISTLFSRVGEITGTLLTPFKWMIEVIVDFCGWLMKSKEGIEIFASVLSIIATAACIGFISNVGSLILRFSGLTTALGLATNGSRMLAGAITGMGAGVPGTCAQLASLILQLGAVQAAAIAAALAIAAVLNSEIQAAKTSDKLKADYKMGTGGNPNSGYQFAMTSGDQQTKSLKAHKFSKGAVMAIENKKKVNNNIYTRAQNIIRAGKRGANYTQAEIKRQKEMYKKGYADNKTVNVLASVIANNHYHNKVLKQQAEQAKKLKEQISQATRIKTSPNAVSPSGSAPGASSPKKHAGKSPLGSKGNPMHVKDVDRMNLIDKYSNLMFDTGGAKWAKWYGKVGNENQITINVENVNASNQQEVDNLIMKMRDGIHLAAKQSLI